VAALRTDDADGCLRIFRSNRDFGLILFAGLLVDAWLAAG
jgi:4-hydroxybenzoate polyprenyltransferase